MSRKILLFILSITLIFTSLCPVYAETAETAVSAEPYKVFYVAPDGNDRNSGDINAPFKTIERARDEVRKYTENMSGDIYVYLRGGEYYVHETIQFGDQDGGTNGYSVYYKNYDGEEPIIYGGEKITGWKNYRGNIYRAKLNIDPKIYNLTENLERSIEACYPNEADDASTTYLWVAKAGTSSGIYTRVFYKPEDINEDMDFSGVRVKLYPEYKYGSITLPMVSIDKNENFLYLDSTGSENSGDPWGQWIRTFKEGQYRLIGALDFLDTPGEFYVDRKGGYVYYWPRKLPIEEQDIVAPVVDRIFYVRGADTDHIARNIHFDGLTVSTTNGTEISMNGLYCDRQPNQDGLFVLENAQNINIENCRITNCGVSAVWVTGWAQENVINGNYIKSTGCGAISLDGYHPRIEGMGLFETFEEAYCNKKNIISNNFIREVGYNAGSGYGICIYESGENQIINNEISRGPRFAIGMLTLMPNRAGWPYWGIDTGSTEIPIINESIGEDFRLSQHNYIAFNDVYDFERETQDGGILYGNATGRGNRFFSNMVHDNWSPWDIEGRFYCIYMDGGAMDWRTNNNIVYNNGCVAGSGGAIFLNSAVYNETQNNVVDVTGGTTSSFSVNSVNATVNRNITYSGEKRDISISGQNIQNPYSMDANMYYTVDGEFIYRDLTGPDTFENRQAGGLYEQESLLGVDPMFVDPENHDYRLREDSPAFALGIESIDQAAIGVTSEFKWRMDQPIQGKNFSESDGIDRQLRISNTKDGGWAKFGDVNFNHLKEEKMWLKLRPQNGGTLEFRLDAPDGELLCSVETGEKVDNSYKKLSADIPKVEGEHDVYVVFKGNVNVCDFDSMRFGSDYDYLPDVAAKTEELRKAGKLTGTIVQTNAGESERVDTTIDPPGSLRLEFENAELSTPGVTYNAGAIGTFNEGTHLGFTQVEMDGVKTITINHGVARPWAGAILEVRLDSPEGPIIGTVQTVATSEDRWDNYQPLVMEVSPTTGIHDIYVTSEGKGEGVGNFDWMRFETGTDKAPVKHNKIIYAEGVEPIGVRTLGDLRIVSSGHLIKPLEDPVYKKDGTVMAPLAETLNNLGYTFNEETLTITDKEGKNLAFKEGNDIAYVNGVAGKMSTSPEKLKSGWWVPIDMFKLLGDYVDYVESSGYVRIMDVNEQLRLDHLSKLQGEDRNLAYKKPCLSSSRPVDESHGKYPTDAFDGDSSTEWWEGNGDKDGWIWVDLNKSYPVTRVVANFGDYAPVSFNVYISNDIGMPENWTRVAAVTKVVGKTVEIKLPTNVHAKYVKLGDLKGIDQNGVRLKEFEVYMD